MNANTTHPMADTPAREMYVIGFNDGYYDGLSETPVPIDRAARYSDWDTAKNLAAALRRRVLYEPRQSLRRVILIGARVKMGAYSN